MVSEQSDSGAGVSRKGSGWKVFLGIFLALSILVNFVLFVLLVLMSVGLAFGAGGVDSFEERIVQHGPHNRKIAVISISGIIGGEKAKDVYKKLRKAREDEQVKGIILRVSSPGGSVSASDRIHNEIRKYREQTGKPVVAFMQGVAASGGYYASVACDKIIAEPTAITGSIGVIMSHFNIQELLEDKLGIQPTMVKSGLKKDWPSMFHEMSAEQIEYLRDKVITPAYNRFVQIVDDGRADLSADEVKTLADGSIYGAYEALEEKLIDGIGYLDEAIEETKTLAGIEQARVIEYKSPFSIAGFLTSQSQGILAIDRQALHELCMPKVLYLWD